MLDMKKISKDRITSFKEMFLKKRSTLLSNLREEDIDGGGDEVDLVQGALLKGLLDKLSLRDKEAIHRIDDALSRIESGTFGLCEDCENPIPEKRLTAIPDCKLCLDCAEQFEKYQRQFRS